MSATLYVVRHGNTFGPHEPPRRIGARSDPPLVESGRVQARAVGRALARTRWAEVLCSPQRRARETAALILGSDAPAPPTAPWLAEVDHGPDEDRPEAAVAARVGAAALAAWDRDATPPPGWAVDAPGRLAGWRAFLARADLGTRLVVTSAGAARFALLADERLREAARALPSLKLRTGAWGRLERDEGGWRIAEWDRRP